MKTSNEIAFCVKCQSTHVGRDAWVDPVTDEVIASFDHMQCLDCGSESIDWKVEAEKVEA